MVKKGEESNENIEEEPLECEEASQASDETLRFSDCHSNCAAGSDYEDCWRSDGSDCSIEIDLESGLRSPHMVERNCRICHLNLEGGAAESGVPIVLGCSCKDDLAAAHKQCAETWFKIRGNK